MGQHATLRAKQDKYVNCEDMMGRVSLTCIDPVAHQSFKVFARNDYAQTCSVTLSIDGDVLDESFIQCRTLFDIPGERVDKRTIRPFVFKDVTSVGESTPYFPLRCLDDILSQQTTRPHNRQMK